MSQNSLKHTESAHIAEELMLDSSIELRRRCATVFKMVNQQVFSLEEALEAYDVPHMTYLSYLAGNSFTEILNGIHAKNDKLTQMTALSVIVKMLDQVKSPEKKFQHILVRFHEYIQQQEGKYHDENAE